MAPAAPAPPAPKFDPREIAGLKLWLDADQASVMSCDPKSVPGLVLWLKADAITGLADNDPVTTWSDSSGNGNDATQATEANKPLYKTSIQNGLPVVRFDGTNDNLATAAFAAPLSSSTIFVVAKTDVNDTGRIMVDGITLASRNVVFMNQGPDGWGVHAGTSQVGGTLDTVFHVFSGTFNAPNERLAVDGKQIVDADGGLKDMTGASVGTDFTGAAWLWDGDIAEVIVYDRALTEVERAGVEKYLADKYALSAGGAPYADNDAVQLWADQSGNGNDVTQATASRKPLFKTGIQAGRPVVRFDGTDDQLRSTASGIVDILAGQDKPFSLFAVIRYAVDLTPGNYIDALSWGRTTSDNPLLFPLRKHDDNTWRVYKEDDAAVLASETTGSPGTAWRMLTVVSPGTTVSKWMDGASLATDAAFDVENLTLDVFSVGANEGLGVSYTLNGDIAEIVIYDRALSGVERQTIERYLATKWNITYSG